MPNFSQAVAENIVRNEDSGIYYLSAKINGKKKRLSLKTKSLKIAKMKRDDMLHKLRAQSPSSKDSKNMTLKECIELTRACHSESGVKKSTMHYYNQLLFSIESKFSSSRAISTISKKETEENFRVLKSHYSPQRFNNILDEFRKVVKIAIKHHARFDDPSQEISRVSIPKNDLVMPTRDEFKQAVESIRAQRKANSFEAAFMVEFIAYSGTRSKEAYYVHYEDVFEDRIKVLGGEDGTKNREIRYVHINPAMQDLLNRMQPQPGVRLFKIKTPYRALVKAYERIGLDEKKTKDPIHGLRHLFCTTCLESGIDPATIAKWVGHKDGGKLVLSTYGHIRDEHSQREAAKVKF